MRRSFLSVLLAAFCLSAAPGYNWTGYGSDMYDDITDSLGAGQVLYSTPFLLSAYEDARIILCVDDTSSAGFASDSVVIEWGYQTGSIVLNSSEEIDTLWDDRMIVDTMSAAGYGGPSTGTVSSDGSLTRSWGGGDTTQVSGYACMSRWFIPEWDVLVRFWVNGLTGNELGTTQEIRYQIRRRNGVNVRGR